jgi:hypothetical protein
MNTDKITRDELIFHLLKGNAHMPFEEAVVDFPEEKMNTLFPNGDYTFWHLLEHIRRTQADILDFMVNPEYKELEWPHDYWPEKNKKATKKDWEQTIKGFLKDRTALQKLVEDPNTDLYAKIPHGTGQTVIREIIVIVDHNAYHLGEFAIMRQVLGAWGKSHT